MTYVQAGRELGKAKKNLKNPGKTWKVGNYAMMHYVIRIQINLDTEG